MLPTASNSGVAFTDSSRRRLPSGTIQLVADILHGLAGGEDFS